MIYINMAEAVMIINCFTIPLLMVALYELFYNLYKQRADAFCCIRFTNLKRRKKTPGRFIYNFIMRYYVHMLALMILIDQLVFTTFSIMQVRPFPSSHRFDLHISMTPPHTHFFLPLTHSFVL